MTTATSEAAKLPDTEATSWRDWQLKRSFGWQFWLGLLIISVLLAWSGKRVELDKMTVDSLGAAGNFVGVVEESQVADGFRKITGDLFPFQISDITEINRIENFDPNKLPTFAYIDNIEVTETVINPDTFEMEEATVSKEVMIEPVGYLLFVGELMLETIEIAMWGTVLAIILSIPLAVMGARNFAPNRLIYTASRSTSCFMRAMHEFVLALFLVLAFGFGTIPGILALGIHTAGFLGKFFADDIENADPGPQEALRAVGASKLKVLRYAVLPQVWPQYIAYVQYLLERNVRSATVIGIAGAGGIGMEFKGRYDMFDFHHISTMLLVIFITVFVMEQVAAFIRGKLIKLPQNVPT